MLLLGSFHRAEISSDTPGPGLDHRARGVCHSLSSQGSVLLGCTEVGEAQWGLGPAFGLMMGERRGVGVGLYGSAICAPK